MIKYIKINNNTPLIQVNDIYIYTYQGGTGKQVMRLAISPDILSFQQINSIFNNGDNPIISEYWKEDTGDILLISEHVGYSKEFQCGFNTNEDYPNQFFIEIVRKTAEEFALERVQEVVNTNMEAIIDLYEMSL